MLMTVVYEKYDDTSIRSTARIKSMRYIRMLIGSLLLFICGATCVKNIRDDRGFQLGVPYFLHVALRV
jgi:hypothetical protein